MPPRTIRLLADGPKRSRVDSPPNSACVGIWWHFGPRLLVILERAQRAVHGTHLIDSALNHADEWDDVVITAHEWFSGQPQLEYFMVPRGRCLLNATTGTGLIYHGNETPRPMLVEIARQYGFRKFEARQDDHYLMGPAADRLFDDEPESTERAGFRSALTHP